MSDAYKVRSPLSVGYLIFYTITQYNDTFYNSFLSSYLSRLLGSCRMWNLPSPFRRDSFINLFYSFIRVVPFIVHVYRTPSSQRTNRFFIFGSVLPTRYSSPLSSTPSSSLFLCLVQPRRPDDIVETENDSLYLSYRLKPVFSLC